MQKNTIKRTSKNNGVGINKRTNNVLSMQNNAPKITCIATVGVSASLLKSAKTVVDTASD